MKKVICFVLVLVVLFSGASFAEEPVYFPDANLKAAVEAALGKANPTPTDMLGLTSLIANSKGITNLTGLEYATNLTVLSLCYNHSITDISPLAGLTTLENLHLPFNSITDISPLAGLISLTSLILSNNTITDISPVAGLTSLTYLYLYDNQITDISPLAGLTSLTSLILSNNTISDIGPLAGLANLTYLVLSYNLLNCPAYDIYIPMIEANNPGIYLTYDPRPPECLNKPPVANAGQDVNTPILFELNLDGSGSYDPDEDYPLSYSWQILQRPQGSVAELSNPDSVNPSLVPDLVGEYIIELVVTDSKGLQSEPNYVVITAIPIEEEVENKLEKTIDEITNLDPDDFKNPNSANALINMIEAALKMVEKGNYKGALNKLSNEILKKTDGCANTGQPDKNDWILTCEDQAKVYPLVLRAIELLQRLLE